MSGNGRKVVDGSDQGLEVRAATRHGVVEQVEGVFERIGVRRGMPHQLGQHEPRVLGIKQDLEVAVQWNLGGQPLHGADRSPPLRRGTLPFRGHVATPNHLHDGFIKHAGGHVEGDQDVPAADEKASEVLAVALALDRTDLRAFLGFLLRLQAADVALAGLDVGLEFLDALTGSDGSGFEVLDIVLAPVAIDDRGQQLATCIGHPLARVFDAFLEIHQVLLAGLDEVVELA